MKKAEIELYDCNYSFGGFINIDCESFEQVDSSVVMVNGARVSFGYEIKEIVMGSCTNCKNSFLIPDDETHDGFAQRQCEFHKKEVTDDECCENFKQKI